MVVQVGDNTSPTCPVLPVDFGRVAFVHPHHYTSLRPYSQSNQNHKFEIVNERKRQREVTVIRSGRAQKLCRHDELVGNVMHIVAGDLVAVDGVLIEASGLRIGESSISGELGLIHMTASAEDDATSHAVLAGPIILGGTMRCIDAPGQPTSLQIREPWKMTYGLRKA
ncbi:hypothetical protein RJ55_06805 [Drechmeria coniospora]|nr:hypothetical protein RJ55_06805 [Drechmeria coniospora]